ncbi:DUF2735 domain-containing protein [Rhizobiaceae bacterium BDR2-2]|uniref:DUF2735 domain-containing protein n=1 Tax=Ectorhizobium quercum TaxID=2965071 RepID=A0AAE3N2I3_9HYPH|nr:DUF2735 domain-containing protein [Ectorhizobium quercum]MCX8996215.1 DUF2735 domain-containing protein [Ectorhizobium quercum]MCX8998746.1 DUF2735 domain-containing protein [Ectorhizobium quercum]
MTAGFHHDSANIYQFPVATRRRTFGQKAENMQSSVIDFPQPVHYAVVDTCWYHQEAIATDGKTTN